MLGIDIYSAITIIYIYGIYLRIYCPIRASLHEEFGRKLMKHAKVGMGREETGYVIISLANIY
jgi:hypothetical protein